VYPLASSRPSAGRDWDVADDAKWRHAHRPVTYELLSLAGLAIDVAARSNWDSPLLFALAPLALVAIGGEKARAGWLWAYVGWLFLTCWLFTHRIDRFWVPLLPVVALLAGVGAAWWWEALNAGFARNRPGAVRVERREEHGLSPMPPWDEPAVIVPIVAAALFNLELMVGTPGFLRLQRLSARLGRGVSIHSAAYSAPELVWLNHESAVLCRKCSRLETARCSRPGIPIVYNTVFDRSIFEKVVRGGVRR